MRYLNILAESSNYLRDHGTVTFLLGTLAVTLALYFFTNRNGRKLPPGPMGLPVFGYYFFLSKNPIEKLNELARKYGNVFSLYLGPKYLVVLNDWNAVKDALSQASSLDRPPSLFAQVPYNFGISGANGPEWSHTRRVTSRTIKDIGLNKVGWEDLLQEEVLDLVRRIAKEGDRPLEVRGFFAESFVNNIVTLIIGERLHVGHPVTKVILRAVDAILEYTPTLGMVNFSPSLSKFLDVLGIEKEFRLSEKVNEFGMFVSDTVDERIRNPNTGAENSFIGRYVEEIQNHKKDNQSSFITVDSLKGNAISLLTGGGETTRTTIVWTLIALADNPDKQRKVHEELDAVIGKDGSVRWGDRFKVPYTFATLMESMRWRSIGAISAMRMASEDMKIQGYHIPKGTFITFNNWSIHNDPKYWKKSEQFIPERFLLEDGKKVNTSPESFNPFSYGKRNCPGKLLAQMATLIYLVTIMQKFKVESTDGKPVKYDTILGLTYQASNVELRFKPR